MEGKLFTTVETFGLSDRCKMAGTRYRFRRRRDAVYGYCEGERWGEFRNASDRRIQCSQLPGGYHCGRRVGNLAKKNPGGFDTFKSVKRRMEVRGVERGVTVIDDFAHHPTAVDETLKALRQKYDGQRLIAVFEPRSRSSRLVDFRGAVTKRRSRTPIT